ncbi:MAG: sigma-54 dependent transcriptional regulator [Thiofilum sp.]|uniref:sigma-54-dependent transcriptional regulator n=1 Tax=Thiofilum sp. TaxID=2212733 RepID=UPI003BB19B59
MSTAFILVVDDEPDIRQLVSEILEDEGYRVETADSAESAREIYRKRRPDLVLLDIWMPGMDGISLLKEWRDTNALIGSVIMMSGHGTIETAVEATKLGAYDFIEKPFSLAKMLLTISNALRTSQLEQENKGLKRQVLAINDWVGSSQVMQTLREQAKRIAQHYNRILLYGEPGVGKQSFARYIHEQSTRRERPFIKTNLASIGQQDSCKLLFGSQDANKTHYGLLDEANGGTLLLAEITELSLSCQQRLLSALQENRFLRMGSTTDWVELDINLIVSSSYDLADDIQAGLLSSDLYYLLNALPLVIPPLREHAEDVPELLNYYVNLLTAQDGLPYRHFTLSAQNFLRNHRWPGNIRELRNLVQRLLILGTEVEITQDEVEEALGAPVPVYSQELSGTPETLFDLPLRQAREQFEHDYLVYQLKQADGNVSKLAEQVRMERTHLYRKMRALGVDPKKYSR